MTQSMPAHLVALGCSIDEPCECRLEPVQVAAAINGEYKLHVSTFATTRVALLTGGAAR